MNRYPPPRTNPPGNGFGDWSPGQRYPYSAWSRFDRVTEARGRRRDRERIACMTDAELSAYIGRAARAIDVSWGARAAYRAAWHELTVRRGAAGVPRV